MHIASSLFTHLVFQPIQQITQINDIKFIHANQLNSSQIQPAESYDTISNFQSSIKVCNKRKKL